MNGAAKAKVVALPLRALALESGNNVIEESGIDIKQELAPLFPLEDPDAFGSTPQYVGAEVRQPKTVGISAPHPVLKVVRNILGNQVPMTAVVHF